MFVFVFAARVPVRRLRDAISFLWHGVCVDGGMVIRRIEEFIAWRHARELERRVFAFTARLPARRDFSFCDDIRRSSASAPRNMAEGFGRFWPAEFAHKLHIAVGELRETLDHLEKALESHYITDADHLEMFGLGDGAIGAAIKFIEYLEAAGPEWKKAYLSRRRETYRAARRLRTTDPSGKIGPTSNPGTPEHKNANQDGSPNENEHEHQIENKDENENENQNQNQNQNASGNPNPNMNSNTNQNANENAER